jgi:hypothetical protein
MNVYQILVNNVEMMLSLQSTDQMNHVIRTKTEIVFFKDHSLIHCSKYRYINSDLLTHLLQFLDLLAYRFWILFQNTNLSNLLPFFFVLKDRRYMEKENN